MNFVDIVFSWREERNETIKRLIRDYWCLHLQTAVSVYVMSQRHDINCNSLWFTLHKLSISENRPCRSHRCPADTN